MNPKPPKASTSLSETDIWFKFWTSAIASHGNSVNGLYLGVLLAGEVVSIAILMSLTFILFVKMIPSSAKYFHNRLFTSVQNAPLAFFTTTDTGQIVNRFSQDLGVLDMELPIAGLILAFNFLMAIIQAIVICISTSYFAAVLPGVMVVMYLLQKFYLRTSRQIRLLDLEAKAPLYSNFLETHNGLVTVRAFGWQMKMKKKNMDLLDASQRPYYLLFCIQRWLALVVDFMVAALATILVALIVKFRRTADAGFVGVSLINIMSFSQSLSVLVMSWTAIETSLGAVQRIKSFVESTKSENLPGECEECPLEWPACGRIVLEGVTAAYALDQASALHNISLTILPGQRIGICGASGSGKSSFVALLLHMLEIQQGKIAIDNIDLSTISRQILRASLNVIPQEPVFFKGTIYQNLDPFCIASPGSAENVLKEVGLWSTITTAGGLDMPMEADELLSHGQRQLFCLARAMLKSSKILIIDEATASVDLETDHLMQKIIKDHFVGCTVIAVAHRLQTIRDFDRIVVFEEGRMAEYGAPDVLLADAASKFRTLWET